MGCRDAVFPEPLLENHTINCLTFKGNTIWPFNKNLSFFRAPALRLPANQRLEKISKLFKLFFNIMDGFSPNQFKGVHMNVMPVVEDLPTLHNLLDDIDNADGNTTGELAGQHVRKHENTVRLLR